MPHQPVDNTKVLPCFGNVDIKILWPFYNQIDRRSENDNSVVLPLRLENVLYILTGDAEAKVWNQIARQIPRNARFFKVPHRGSLNGRFGSGVVHPGLYDAQRMQSSGSAVM